jgi:hypothetical protein
MRNRVTLDLAGVFAGTLIMVNRHCLSSIGPRAGDRSRRSTRRCGLDLVATWRPRRPHASMLIEGWRPRADLVAAWLAPWDQGASAHQGRARRGRYGRFERLGCQSVGRNVHPVVRLPEVRVQPAGCTRTRRPQPARKIPLRHEIGARHSPAPPTIEKWRLAAAAPRRRDHPARSRLRQSPCEERSRSRDRPPTRGWFTNGAQSGRSGLATRPLIPRSSSADLRAAGVQSRGWPPRQGARLPHPPGP